MSRQRKSKRTTQDTLDDSHIRWASVESHPAQASGIFVDDPTFEEFCELLRQQRAEDYRRASEDIEAMIRQGEEARRCSSSTPTPSHATKTRTPSSAHE